MTLDERESAGEEGASEGAPGAFQRGFCWEGGDLNELRDVVDAAFDYRGDVTITLGSGEEVTGYVANRDGAAGEPFLQAFSSDGGPRRRILYRDIRSITFSGKDPASGKSWESWVRKWTAKKEAEARGERVERIGLFPEELK